MKKTLRHQCCGGALRLMKILSVQTFLALLLASMAYAHDLSGQGIMDKEISIEIQDSSLKKVLSRIERLAGVKFTYSPSVIEEDQKVSVKASGQTLADVLDALLGPLNIRYKLIADRISLYKPSAAAADTENRYQVSFAANSALPITGTVLDAESKPLPGASVVEKGTSNGTTTDADGRFSLVVGNDNAVLVFSFIGYLTQEVATNGRSVIDITLQEDVQNLEEVVVVGYGEQKKINLTGAIDVVSGEDLSNRPAAQVGQLLQGQAPSMLINMNMRGSEPGASQKFQIRGVGTISGNSAPLVLVDGVEMDINLVDPSSIESVSILKDAASAAIYGSRAATGVILIQTKKGDDRPLRVSYGNITSINRPIYVPDMMDSYTYATVFNQARANAGLSPTFGPEQMDRIKGYMEGTYPYPYNPDQPPNSIWQGRWMGNANVDWAQEYFRDYSVQQKHNINVEGGTKNTQYYATVGLLDQPGIFTWGNDHYERYNFLANVSTRANDWLKLDFSARAAKVKKDQPNGGVWGDRSGYWMHVNILWPTMPKYNIDGTINNPLMVGMMNGGRVETEDNNSMFSASTELEPVKGWKTNLRFSYTNRSGSTTNMKYPVDVTIATGLIGNIGFPQTGIYEQVRTGQYTVFTGTTRYEKEIGGHYFSAMAGYEQHYDFNRWMTAEGFDLTSLDVPSISTALGTRTVDDAVNHWALQGYFGRINYNFNEKYLLELNARYDGTSRYEDGQRWGFFPSASVGYNISSEDFWDPIQPYVQNLKLRASYGTLGNQNIVADQIIQHGQSFEEVHDPNAQNYLYLERIPIEPLLGRIIDGVRPIYADMPQIRSQRLTWETIRTTNIGVDAGFLNNRLTAEFDWYYRITEDMMGPSVQLPSVLGAGAPPTNNARLATKGYELTLSWKDQVGDFSYNGKFMLGDYQTEILEYINETGGIYDWYAGRKHGDVWGLTTDGLIQQDGEDMPDQTYYYTTWGPGDMKYVDLNQDGKVDPGLQTLEDHGDLSVIVNTTPRYQLGLSAGVKWKSLDFNMFWQGIGSHPFIPNSGSEFYWGHLSNPNSAILLEGSQHLDYWRPANETNFLGPNTDAFQPKPYFSSQRNKNFQTQTRFIDNARYVRLKNLQIGFTLPKHIVQRTFIDYLRVYFSGENLLTFQSMDKVFEPENMVASNTFMRTYPITQMYSLGLNITF
ncbi:MAG: TonB-dependent receptor [Chryseosolibacter sp.]